MANVATAVSLNPQTSTQLSAAGGNRFRIYNSTNGPLFVRLAPAAASPYQGGYDIVIPEGLQYFSDYAEYVGEIRGYSEKGGVVNISVD